jgi:hypothetical protein
VNGGAKHICRHDASEAQGGRLVSRGKKEEVATCLCISSNKSMHSPAKTRVPQLRRKECDATSSRGSVADAPDVRGLLSAVEPVLS